MIVFFIGVLGLCLGSFVNALVWRLHEQAALKKTPKNAQRRQELSISTGRSMCPHCGHTLAASDLVPIASWVSLRGRCRYCKVPISWQYPLVELLCTTLFIISYVFWPYELTIMGSTQLTVWLVSVVCMLSLAVYDARWKILPTKIILVLAGLGVVFAGTVATTAPQSVLSKLVLVFGAVLLLWGLFRGIYAVSRGAWIGFGDVRLAIPLALFAADPQRVLLLLFIASLLGTLTALPLLISRKTTKTQTIAFGPYLLIGCFVVVVWGDALLGRLDTLLFAV